MSSPGTTPIAPRTGQAGLEVRMVAGESAVTGCWAVSPLKLLTPRARGASVWAYTSSFGGGMVAGDETGLEVTIEAGATCFLGTQASTKVYRNPQLRPCQHVTKATIGENGLLILAPDPVQCFAQSIYQQHQEFHLQDGAALVLVDWLSSGRAACGERWSFTRYRSRNEVFMNGRRVFLDSLLLAAEDGSEDLLHQMGRFHCLASAVILGAKLEEYARLLLENVAEEPVSKRGAMMFSASAVAGGVLLRLAGVSTEQVGKEIARRLSFISPILKDDPWARKW